MNILVTGSKGFIGSNLLKNLYNIKKGKNTTRPDIVINEIYECDRNTDPESLNYFCKKADFVFNFAGVNRPKNKDDFMKINYGFTLNLLNMLKLNKNTATVMFASSIQAELTGRYKESEYGKSKLACEELLFSYSKETGAKVLVYRFPNVFGKWARPNYNSVIATFCNNIARDLPIEVHDRTIELQLLYIDDLIEEMFDALEGKEHHYGKFCFAPEIYKATLGNIVDLLNMFKKQPITLQMPNIPNKSLTKKLYSTYLSYLPKEKISFPLKMNLDYRGSFTELLKMADCGQISVNISKPGITKGQHWHNTKWEFFIVVYGHALIQQRRIGSDEILKFDVSGEKIQAVHMLPGYTHSITNLSDIENLITLMWANEQFDLNHPDTFFEQV